MKNKLIYLLKKPIILFLLSFVFIVCIVSAAILLNKKNTEKNSRTVAAETAATTEQQTTTLTTASRSTTSATTTSTTTTTTAVTSPYEICTPALTAGTSPNSSFYQERLAIAGDSLALGFNVYGFIPDMHNIATESMSVWNLDYFTFNYGYGELGLVDAVEFIHPKLLYMSVGMNDVNMNFPEPYITRYREIINEITGRVTDISIVVAAITPVCSYCDIVRNDIIREYNTALEQMVNEIDSPRVCFFDAYSVVCDENLNLRDDYTSGDGMHLYAPCYNDILTALFNYLDTMNFREQLGG